MSNQKIIQHQNLRDKIYLYVKEEILEHRLAEGERINLDRIAAETGVSKTPLREALVRLEKEGFVISVPRGGTFVRKISEKEMREIYEIREALEGLAVRLAAKRIDEAGLRELSGTCRRFEEALESKDIRLCHQNDLRFHQLLTEAGGNEHLSMMVETVHQSFAILISRSPEYWSRAGASLRDHHAILEALSKGDGETAAGILGEHIKRGKEALFL